MTEARSSAIWLAVLITVVAVMAGLLLLSAWAYLEAADGTMAVARDRSLEPAVPMGALTMAPDMSGCDPGQVRMPPEDDCVQGYIPLLGYVWWFGPLGALLLVGVALAIAFSAGRRVRSWAIVTVAIVAFVVTFAVATWRLGTLRWDQLAGFSCPLPALGRPAGLDTCQVATWSEAAVPGLILGAMVGGAFGIVALLGRYVGRQP
jgi:hypothetical protein